MCSGKQIIDGIYKLCYNIRIVCGANGRVAFLSSKAMIKSRHFLKTESVDFSLCKKYVIMKQKRGNKSELYKASKRVLWKAQ